MVNPARNVNRFARKYFVYLVLALLALLVYANRKSFVKVAGGGGAADAGACETLCGDVLGGVPDGATYLMADGSVKTQDGEYAAGSNAAKVAKEQACSGGGGAAAPAPPARRTRR